MIDFCSLIRLQLRPMAITIHLSRYDHGIMPRQISFRDLNLLEAQFGADHRRYPHMADR